MATNVLRMIRWGAIALIAVLALVWAGIGLGLFGTGRQSGGAVPSYGQPLVASFSLVDQDNRAVGAQDILGRPAVVFFGFTSCPEVCPTTLLSLSSALARLGPAADRLGVFFVTVDPQRDTPGELKQYLSSFDPRIRGLTGADAQIAAIAKPLGVYYARTKVEGGGYTMDHTASVFLLDAQGQLIGTIAYGENANDALAKLKRLAGGT